MNALVSHLSASIYDILQIEEDLGLHDLVAELTSGPASAQTIE